MPCFEVEEWLICTPHLTDPAFMRFLDILTRSTIETKVINYFGMHTQALVGLPKPEAFELYGKSVDKWLKLKPEEKKKVLEVGELEGVPLMTFLDIIEIELMLQRNWYMFKGKTTHAHYTLKKFMDYLQLFETKPIIFLEDFEVLVLRLSKSYKQLIATEYAIDPSVVTMALSEVFDKTWKMLIEEIDRKLTTILRTSPR